MLELLNNLDKQLFIFFNVTLANPVFDNIVNNMEGDVRPFIYLLKNTLNKMEEVLALLESNYPEIHIED